MAEFIRKSRSKRIIQSINTTKASKREVYDFYQKWRKQYGVKGKALDINAVKKADLVRELEKLEKIQHEEIQPERKFFREYEKTKKQVVGKTPSSEVRERLQKLQAKAEKLQKAGKIDPNIVVWQETKEQPKPRYKRSGGSGGSKRGRQRANVYYKGKMAHDFIKKMCDDALLDTEDFEDSQEIWYAISLVETNSEEFDFFSAFYAGNYKKGSRDYYLGEGGFEDFLRLSEKFEQAMAAAQLPIPEYGTAAYWTAFKKWVDEQGGTTKL